jgi:hypothetical protein
MFTTARVIIVEHNGQGLEGAGGGIGQTEEREWGSSGACAGCVQLWKQETLALNVMFQGIGSVSTAVYACERNTFMCTMRSSPGMHVRLKDTHTNLWVSLTQQFECAWNVR